MKKLWVIIISLLTTVLVALGVVFWDRSQQQPDENEITSAAPCQRIISLSPNITETLFALGLGDRIVGVTRFCNFPPEAKKIPAVGGYLDPSFEAMVRLKPDMVLLLPESQQVKNFLSQLGIPHLEIANKTIADILNGIALLGKTFGAEQQADTLLARIRARIDRIRKLTANRDRPGVLIVIERSWGTGLIRDVYIAGKNTFYDELLRYAGGRNAFSDERIAYPRLSAEGILQLNPDFIIDLVPQLNKKQLTVARVAKDWDSLAQLSAVKNHRIHIMYQDYAVVPGPRFIQFLDDLARIIHPEMNWQKQ